MKAQRYIVSGRVQGVNYRWFVQKTAGMLGLKGWVRNLNDGRVEVFAEGEESLLVKLEEQLKKGPSLAHVTNLERFDEQPQAFHDFQITF